ncbi:MAG: putative transposase [Yoonia sp.]|jgi:putative transposase
MTASTITQLSAPQGFSPDSLTEILRSGAHHLIQQAVEAELSVLMDAHSVWALGGGFNAVQTEVWSSQRDVAC